eukprot:TRINITY_DN2107_c0_g1_i1.p1 TRINITY_DN2107_c0_g1~~TRINITY_DN2107_c0_g1_i1.p1  ORF type:complete len:788 (-),score=194.36 TRINITY_DN2107_c0_g1_i1:65-2272(-)
MYDGDSHSGTNEVKGKALTRKLSQHRTTIPRSNNTNIFSSPENGVTTPSPPPPLDARTEEEGGGEEDSGRDNRKKRTASLWRPLPDSMTTRKDMVDNKEVDIEQAARTKATEPRRLKWDKSRGTYRFSQKNIDDFFQNLVFEETTQQQQKKECEEDEKEQAISNSEEQTLRERSETLLRAFGHLLHEPQHSNSADAIVSGYRTSSLSSKVEPFKRATTTTSSQVRASAKADSVLVGAARLTTKPPLSSTVLPSVRIASRRSRRYVTVATKKGKSIWSRVLPFFGKGWFHAFLIRKSNNNNTIKAVAAAADQRCLATSQASSSATTLIEQPTQLSPPSLPSSGELSAVGHTKIPSAKVFGVRFGKKSGKSNQKRETTNSSMSIVIENKNSEVRSGSVLTGRVEVDLSHQLNIRGVWLKVEGCDSCYWIGTASTCFSCSKPFLDNEILLDPTTFLPSGHSSFRFSYTLPSNSPSSYRGGTMMEFKRGISYRLSACFKGTSEKPKGPRATKFFSVLREGREAPATPPRKLTANMKNIYMKCTLNVSEIEIGGDVYIAIEISNQSKKIISSVRVEMKEKHKQQVPAKHIPPMKAHHVLYSIVEDVSHETPPYQLTKKYKIPVMDDRTWASIETPNKLFKCYHQIVTTITIKGKSELQLKLPVTVLPVVIQPPEKPNYNYHPNIGSTNNELSDMDKNCTTQDLVFKTCHSLLQSPELRPPVCYETNHSAIKICIPSLNKM